MKFIAALNAIGSPILAVIVIVLGCIYSIVSKQYGLDGNTAAGIVGAGIGLLTGQVLSRTNTQMGDNVPTRTQQSTGTPVAPAPPSEGATNVPERSQPSL